MRRRAIAAMVAVLMAAPLPALAVTPRDLASYYEQSLSWKPCHGKLECAQFDVPLDYANPAGPRITITAARSLATGTSRGALVLNPGGPGGSGIDFIQDPSAAVAVAARRNFDLVSFDPRGVGESTPLWCLRGAKLDAFLEVDPTPDNAGEQSAFVRAGRALAAACQRENAPLMAHMSVVDVARDLDVLRALLGEERLRYVGKSWGTVLGKVYASLFPNQVGSFVLDGAVDVSVAPQKAAYQQGRGFEQALNRFLAWCVRKGSCPLGKTQVLAKARLLSLVRGLDAAPMQTEDRRRPLTEADAITAIIGPLYINAGGFSWLKAALEPALRHQDGTALMVIADWFTDRGSNGVYASNANTAIYITNCFDGTPAVTSVAHAEKLAARWSKTLPFLGAVMAWSDLTCAAWPFRSAIDISSLKVRDVPPILVVAATHDPATPIEWARGLVTQLPNAVLLIRDGDGHTSYANGSVCIDRAVDAYLLSPDMWKPVLPTTGRVCAASS